MKFSIVTPAFNAARWLPACVASVRHACAGVDYEHWVMDGGSKDGTVDFLKSQPDVRWVSEKDSGMYDALNKGMARATGDVVGHLNADEQYNRAGLQEALALLKNKPQLDAAFSATVMVDATGKFLQLFKQIATPRPVDTLWCMPVQSCSLIFRRAAWQREPYNTSYRIVADHVWFRHQMEAGMRLAPVSKPIGIFTWRSDNLSNTAKEENALPDVNRDSFHFKFAKNHYRWRKFLAGGYRRDAVDYDIIQDGSVRSIHIDRPALKLPIEQLRGLPSHVSAKVKRES